MAVNISALSGGTINTVALAAPLDSAMRDVITRLFGKMRTAMPWITYDPVGVAILAMDQQSYPYPIQTLGTPPVWLNTIDRQQVWKEVAGEFVPVTQQVLATQIAQARVAGEALDRNVAFWNNVARYSGADAVQKVWDDFWAAVASFRAQRDATKVALDQTAPIISQYGAKIPASLIMTRTGLVSKFNDLSNRASAALNPVGAQAKSAAGLGALPLVIAGIAAATIVTVTASIWAIAHEFANVQEQANGNAQEILKAREAADQADFNAGKITNEQLVVRRNDNIAAAVKLVDAEGAAAVGGAVGRAGMGVALGAGGLVALALGAWWLLRKKSA